MYVGGILQCVFFQMRKQTTTSTSLLLHFNLWLGIPAHTQQWLPQSTGQASCGTWQQFAQDFLCIESTHYLEFTPARLKSWGVLVPLYKLMQILLLKQWIHEVYIPSEENIHTAALHYSVELQHLWFMGKVLHSHSLWYMLKVVREYWSKELSLMHIHIQWCNWNMEMVCAKTQPVFISKTIPS